MKQLEWHGLYKNGWKGEIVAEAYSHPAKFSRGLIRQIYAHLLEQGYLKEGDTVVDPFGGVALGALEAMVNGCNWVGVELEQKFVDLGSQNIALWNKRYAGKLRKWGAACLLKGDSRELIAVLGRNGIDCAVSSPPFVESLSSGKLSDEMKTEMASRGHKPSKSGESATYGADPRNLGNLKVGNVDSVISSPPYSSDTVHGRPSGRDSEFFAGRTIGEHGLENYGTTPGQLGAMKPGALDGAVSSPPFMHSDIRGVDKTIAKERFNGDYRYSTETPTDQKIGGDRNSKEAREARKHRAESVANLGNIVVEGANEMINVDTFWTDARTIVEQTYAALKPGGCAAWVVKSFVRNKQIVDFPGQWRQLCEAVGFETLEEIHAMLVEEKGTQIDTENKHHVKTVERKSFFRRLAESKGSPRIDFETVWVMRKVCP